MSKSRIIIEERNIAVELVSLFQNQNSRPTIGRFVSLKVATMSAMDVMQLTKFKNILESHAKELRHTIAETQMEGRITQEAHGRDEADRASRSHEKELLFRRNTQVRNLLRTIDSALGRIADGTFGECINCGQEINAKRLEALPWTRFCITCQELLER